MVEMYFPPPKFRDFEPVLALNLGSMTHVQEPRTPRSYFDCCPFTDKLALRIRRVTMVYRDVLSKDLELAADGPMFQRRHVEIYRRRLLSSSRVQLTAWVVLHLREIAPGLGEIIDGFAASSLWPDGDEPCCDRRRTTRTDGDALYTIGAQYVEAVGEHWRRQFGGLDLAG
jgi:hypothetical protein